MNQPDPNQTPRPEKAEEAPKPSLTPAETEAVRERAIDALRTVYDPEIPVNIYDLGLIYEVEVQPDGYTLIRMTLTSPACPVAETLPGEVEMRVRGAEGVSAVEVEIVWDPPWDPSKMSEAARLTMGFF